MATLTIEVPDALAAQVMEGLQSVYPDLIVGATTPAQAMRAVVAFWTEDFLANHAANRTRTAGASQITAAQQQLDVAVAQAAAQARAAVRAAMADQPTASPPTE